MLESIPSTTPTICCEPYDLRVDRRAFLRGGLWGGALLLAGSVVGCGSGGGGKTTPGAPTRGAVVGYRALGTLPGVSNLYTVDYRTVDAVGASITASGLVGVPAGAVSSGETARSYPMLAYFHGTTTVRTDVPTVATNLEGQAIAQLFGAGYIVVAPDYPGLGDDTTGDFQSFEQAAPLAAMAIDLLNAAQSLMRTLSVGVSGRLFLTGFSEGGYAAMAVHRAIEAQPATVPGLTVVASAPIAGPYDLSGTTFDAALTTPGPDTVALVAGLLLAYNPVYNLYAAPAAAFAAPYAGSLPGLFDGTHTLGEIAAALPATVPALLSPAFLQATPSNPAAPLLAALRANDVYDWKNTAPIRLYHSPTDEEVPYQNAVLAQQTISARGGDIQLVTIGRNANHTASAALAAPMVVGYFASLL